jgi:hypothetical protein
MAADVTLESMRIPAAAVLTVPVDGSPRRAAWW